LKRRVSDGSDDQHISRDVLETIPLVCSFQPFQSVQPLCHPDRETRLLDIPDVPDVPDGLGPHSRKAKGTAVNSFFDAFIFAINWFVPALVGVAFLLMGSLKLYGFFAGVVGGADKPFVTQLCGT
jgi:hypothetical protein